MKSLLKNSLKILIVLVIVLGMSMTYRVKATEAQPAMKVSEVKERIKAGGILSSSLFSSLLSDLLPKAISITKELTPKIIDIVKTQVMPIAQNIIENLKETLTGRLEETVEEPVEKPEEKPSEGIVEEPVEIVSEYIINTDIIYGDLDLNKKIDKTDLEQLDQILTLVDEVKKVKNNANEKIDIKTVIETMEATNEFKKEELAEFEKMLDCADVNFDDMITAEDKDNIDKYIKEEIKELPVVTYGDLNNDGKADVADYEMLQAYLNSLKKDYKGDKVELTNKQLIKANLVKDAAIDEKDLEKFSKDIGIKEETKELKKETEKTTEETKEEKETSTSITNGLMNLINKAKDSKILQTLKTGILSKLTSLFNN